MKLFLIVVGVVMLFAGKLVVQNMRSPKSLGHKNGKLAALQNKPNGVSSQTDDVKKQVEPLPFQTSEELTLSALIQAIEKIGGNVIQRQDSNYLYTIFTTPAMHFHDDVEMYLDASSKVVHFRSQSRAGYSDMGVNRKRYNLIRDLYLS